MTTAKQSGTGSRAEARAERPGSYDAFLARLGDRDRQNVQRHVAVCEEEATDHHAVLWKRLASCLSELAPLAVHTIGCRAVQFFVADGRYRLQVFALEDARDGSVTIYSIDAVDQAVRAGALRGPVGADGEAMLYEICEEPRCTLKVEALTAARTTGAPDFYRHMLGWNRKAVRLTLPNSASPAQVKAAEILFALSTRTVGQP
jgi:hypothetical protein